MILLRTYDDLGIDTGLLWKLYEYGYVHVMLKDLKDDQDLVTLLIKSLFYWTM